MSTPAPCPVCRKNPAISAFKPFCSKRCADIDLGKWFLGSYSVASETPLEEEDIEQILQASEQ